MNNSQKMDRHGPIDRTRSREVEPQFAMTFMGSLLALLIIILVCVIIWMWIRCIRGVREEYFNKRENLQHRSGQNDSFLERSSEDIESGNPMTYYPHFLTIRHSALVF